MKDQHRSGHGLIAAALTFVLSLQAAGSAGAATCMDELDRFERRLHSSNLAATDPDTFNALVRRAEEAAELRDEEQCLQSVAELNEELPEDSGLQPVARQSSSDGGGMTQDSTSRPAAPVLMIAGGEEAAETSAEDEPDDGDDSTND